MKVAVNVSGLGGGLDFSELEKVCEAKYFGELPREEMLKTVSDCDAILINKIVVDEQFLVSCPKIKYVGTFSTGYNLVDLKACTRRGVVVCNVPNYSTSSVAQHAFALLLNFLGKINEYVSAVNAGEWIKSQTFCYAPFPTHELSGKTFGIFGYGNIGTQVAKIATAFGANVIVCSRNLPDDCPYEVVSFDDILARSDILSLHCPLTEDTANVINAESLKKMKKTAILINTARGGLVDESALANALNSGAIGGACLDTVAEEPMLASNPLYGAKNCLITPHVAWIPLETRERLLSIVFDNFKAFLSGKPKNQVN